MPQDSLYINNKAQKQNSFDAIVVGSGISGGWAAKELCEKGLKTLMIERGRKVEHVKDYSTATMAPWEFPHHGGLTREEKKDYYVQSRHWSLREDNKHFYIRDTENPYHEISRYDWVRGDIVGGRSLLWSRACYRLSDFDFEANIRDGHGIDWPIRYRDIAPWYDYVEKFAGISGQKEGLPQLPDGNFQAPMPMNCVENWAKEILEKKFRGLRVTIGRVANLTGEHNGRGPCQYRNLCHRGCPFGAYFSTQSATLPAATKTGNLKMLCDTLVNNVIFDKEKGRAIGVEVMDKETSRTYVYYARIIFLNASTLGTSFILLNSKSAEFPNGMGNNHDVVGRHLMDHHKCGSMGATIEGFGDKYYFGRRANGIYIPRFKNLAEKEKDFLRGYNLQGNAGRSRGRSNATPGIELKTALSEPGDWNIGFTAFGECLPYAENRVLLNENLKDHWGRPTLTMDCQFRENEKKMWQDEIQTGREILETLGGKNIRLPQEMSFPGNANHEMGTARMGKNTRQSVLNKWNQMHEVPNVFITDGSCMTSSGCVNPSLTFMALTARACDYAMRELKKGNL